MAVSRTTQLHARFSFSAPSSFLMAPLKPCERGHIRATCWLNAHIFEFPLCSGDMSFGGVSGPIESLILAIAIAQWTMILRRKPLFSDSQSR